MIRFLLYIYSISILYSIIVFKHCLKCFPAGTSVLEWLRDRAVNRV